MWQKKLSLTGAVCLIVRAVEEILTNEWFSPSLQSKVFDPLIPARFECSVIIVGRCLLYKFESYAKRSIFDFVMPSGAVSDLLKLQDCQRKHSQIIGRVAGKRKKTESFRQNATKQSTEPNALNTLVWIVVQSYIRCVYLHFIGTSYRR